jgi:glutamyl-tRNA synthetase
MSDMPKSHAGKSQVVTRFAPSPTGFLHIGGARTALFNWLYARGRGGKFLLRIEDTDRERSTDAAVAAILDGLKWLGLDWDGDPIYQYARAKRHQEIAQELLAKGHAYKCYCTPAELEGMREAARAAGKSPGYSGKWRDRPASDAPAGVAPAIRFKAPRTGETVIDDQVQGRVVFQNENLDDLVILRGDGNPTYNLSVVVDDHDMGVTHIIRGDDHLTNAARQSQIYAAMGWDRPSFSHIPLIHGPDGAKLSKRHGALGVEAYRDMGYLTPALRNYLVRLGWSHGDDEIMSSAQMLEWFDLAAIGRSPARMDFLKMANVNGHYMRETSSDDLMTALREMVTHAPDFQAWGKRRTEADWARLRAALPGLKERATTLVKLIDSAEYLFAQRPLAVDAEAQKHLDADGKAALKGVFAVLSEANAWDATALEAAVKAYAEGAGLKLGKLAQPLRVALTGKTTSPGIFDVLASLGREESLARLKDQQ